MKPGLYATLERIAATIEERKHGDVKTSYVARLLSQGEDALLKKIGEEATETVLAAKSGDRQHLVRRGGAADGFRAINNTGRVGHQEVNHLHMPVLGGPEPLGPMLQRRK